jgi:hypothetical protein
VRSESVVGEEFLKNLSLAKCVAQRLQVSHLEQGGLSVTLGHNGLVCVGVGSYEGIPPLLLIYDEGIGGKSAHAETCLKELLPFLSTNWMGLFPVVGSTVVIRTRDGLWDRAMMMWSQNHLVRGFELLPVRWFDCVSRSEEAFAETFGVQARRAQHILFRMRALKLGSLGT